MRRLIDKYAAKLVSQGLADEADITFLGLDAELSSNRPPEDVDAELRRVFDLMNINTLLFARQAEPYRSITEFLAAREGEFLLPNDCETRTFFHDIPIIDGLDADLVYGALSRRKAAIIRGRGVISAGSVSPEQAFVSYSSVCFSTFVKFFSDALFACGNNGGVVAAGEYREALEKILPLPDPGASEMREVRPSGPLRKEDVLESISETGRALVRSRLIDSYFGNISYVFGDSIFISQTGSSMDELDGCVDEVPLDGSSSSGITASSELSAHLGIHRKTGHRAIVHGHPRFTVILSMSCRRGECDLSTCYTTCAEPREVLGIPVVSGEIGTGSHGLARTVPDAMAGRDAVIVFGHGIFAAGAESFRSPFEHMVRTEQVCREECLKKIIGVAGETSRLP